MSWAGFGLQRNNLGLHGIHGSMQVKEMPIVNASKLRALMHQVSFFCGSQ